MQIYLKKMHPDAVILSQKEGNIGFDIYAVETTVLLPQTVTKLRTGLAIADYNATVEAHALKTELTFDGTDVLWHRKKFTVYPKIEGRSGLAAAGIFPVGNIVDPNYRGEICVTLANLGPEPYTVEKGHRMAQFVFYAALTQPELSFIETDEIIQTERGAKGFGSSGK